MDRATKVFFVFCFMVFFLGGCGTKNRTEKVNGSAARIDAKTLEQRKLEAQKKELAEFQRLISTADKLFSQSWRIITQKSAASEPSNVFRIVNELLWTYQEKQKEQREHKKQKAPAPGRANSEISEKAEFVPVLKIQTVRSKSQGKMIKQYSVGIESEDADQVIIARFWKEPAGFWAVDFNAEHLGGELNGLGRLGPLLAREQVSCSHLVPSNAGILFYMKCTNLAQDIDEHRVLKFDSMTLDRRLKVDQCEQAFKLSGVLIDQNLPAEKSQTPLTMNVFCENGEPKINLENLDLEASQDAPTPAEVPVTSEPPETPPQVQPEAQPRTEPEAQPQEEPAVQSQEEPARGENLPSDEGREKVFSTNDPRHPDLKEEGSVEAKSPEAGSEVNSEGGEETDETEESQNAEDSESPVNDLPSEAVT